jgi:hypothetical protein
MEALVREIGQRMTVSAPPVKASSMSLEKELATYRVRLPELLSDDGKYVLIRGDDVAGIYDTYEDALRVGYARFGLEDFLVKKIESVETVHYFSRDFAPCQP